ncbi:pyruvate carboxylase [Anaerobranca gottschalkii]|uniref:Pyruvate carboxylase n=1 Tax=Anaerobranca gottschalkii DSM 13577 TaxID=1120990 RepID=A0A1I0B6V9_9FIRM|nr:pyruvate carboxylase [Anaerobranca gottschalkii]SET02465.1 pyruvate carboxylase [Anaerobranca gottschalkii DSM 13577]
MDAQKIKKFKRVLVANRGEIAIRIFRACKELGIRTVAIYSEEDKTSLFRTKADESYLIGKNKGPVEAYLSIDEIISLALKKGVDAIHPGYGFLAENPEFARKCRDAGLEFIGPSVEVLEKMGDKITSKQVAINAQVPVIPGIDKPIQRIEEALNFVKDHGFPVIIKAALGGGGRGMRIVRNTDELLLALDSAKSEAKKAFGVEDVFIEKYLDSPKHIEVQILGDNYGNIVHLYERDCSIQRRHQKLIEYAPAFSLSEKLRKKICEDALKLAKSVNYSNAGTVEFLVDKTGNHYFIEMNPRIQVEHTVTEVITGIDIVQCQILIAQGYPLNSEKILIGGQHDIQVNGYAIQSRITTEDPTQNFAPDTGKIDVYRTSSGFGIRLDGGNGFTGSIITPFYDSLLVKVTAHSRTFEDAVSKAVRALKEMNISGVKTNIPFLINVLTHETFLKGLANTNFINENPELFNITPKSNKELKLLNFLGEKIIKTKGQKGDFDVPIIPKVQIPDKLEGTKQILEKSGPKGVVKWIKVQKKLLITDTTMRDAHQSLIATRLRTKDMLNIAQATSFYGKDLFSLEMWGGATFDVAYRFLKECPWKRLEELRKRIPNIMFQMLLRGSNAVGYKNYPDNVIRSFIKEASKSGIDIFRIFDSLNWLKGMEVALDEVLLNNRLAEVCICYTGDILDERRDKYSLNYYIKKAKEIEKMGAHILGIKDMAGLLKPYAAYKLISALKNEVGLPIHLHTHDTSGNGVATLLMAAEGGVDIVDTSFNSFAGTTSQPPMSSVVAALENTPRETGINLDYIEEISQYWGAVRQVYYPFESDLKSCTTEVYKYEIPGGQYSNLKPQVENFGLGHRFKEVKEMYKKVNYMLGDIVKVTPSSKMVGDMAIFMVQNNLTPENIFTKGKGLNFPESVVDYFKGLMGQPEGGFPKELQALILKGEKPITKRPGEILPPEDFNKIALYLKEKHDLDPTEKDILSFALYPKVFDEYLQYIKETGDFSRMGSDIFFHGLGEGETCEVEIADGKILVVKLLQIGPLDSEGNINLSFEVNGQRRDISIKNPELQRTETETSQIPMADPENIKEIPASIPGAVLKILVNQGDNVTKNQPVIILEAMKMETIIVAPISGKVDAIFVKEKENVKAGQLLLRLS